MSIVSELSFSEFPTSKILHTTMRIVNQNRSIPLLRLLLHPERLLTTVIAEQTLLRALIGRGIAQRFQGSFFQVLWPLITPLFLLTVYYWVFGTIFQVKFGDPGTPDGVFALVMFGGMALYAVFQDGVLAGAYSILGQAQAVKKVVFPIELLPVAAVTSSAFFAAAYLLIAAFGAWLMLGIPGIYALSILPVLLILFVLTLGTAFFVASLAVYFRDVPPLLTVLLQGLFFATPIIYPISIVPEKLRAYLYWNPLTALVETGRNAYFFNQPPEWECLIYPAITAAVIFYCGYLFFMKTKRGVADVL